MMPYLKLLGDVLALGERRTDRTGVGTISLFGTQSRYDLREGFPLVTTKKVNFALVVRELLWFLRGETNVNQLVGAEQLWKPWAKECGGLGPIYGHQWRNWGSEYDFDWDYEHPGVDQIAKVIESIKTNPDSRRHIVSAWNVGELDSMALPPCHVLHQYYVSGDYLDMQMYQRSADLAIGVPFNIASYALMLEMMALECGKHARHLVHTIGDAHIYANHVPGVVTQLMRDPLPLPTLQLRVKPFFEITEDDIILENYTSHPFIKFDVAV